MSSLRFTDCVVHGQIQPVLRFLNKLTGLTFRMHDPDGVILVEAGRRDRASDEATRPVLSHAIAERSDILSRGNPLRLKNADGTTVEASPIIIAGDLAATLTAGPFFLNAGEHETPSHAKLGVPDRADSPPGCGYFPSLSIEEDEALVGLLSAQAQILSELWLQALQASAENEGQAVAQQSLLCDDKRFRSIVEITRDLIAHYDRERRHLYVNPVFLELFGDSPSDYIGKTMEEAGYSAGVVKAWNEAIEHVVRSGQPARGTVGLTTPCGEVMVDWQMMPEFDSRGEVISFLIVARDITGQVNAEKAVRDSKRLFHLTLSSLQDAVFILDSSSDIPRVLDCNPAAEAMFGYSKEEMIGKPGNFFHVSDASYKSFRWHLHRATAAKGYLDYLEIPMCRKDGTIFPTERSVVPLQDEKGHTLGWVSVVRDITERKRTEEEMLRIEKLESIGILAGGIAHDFNNLLTAIVGNLSLAKHAVHDREEVVDLLIQAEMASQRAKELTQQLLTFSKGGMPVKRTTSIASLVQETSHFILHGSRSRCELAFSPDLWLADIDSGQISQVLNNVIINADQAMPQSGIVQVTAENVTVGSHFGLPISEGDYVVISVADNGIGIPREHMHRIFDPYFTTKQKGSGLGLATAFSIVKKHGGTITAESEIGVGSTFRIYLPASRNQSDLDSHTAVDEREEKTSQGRILVMDDEQSVREVTRRMLQHVGYEVTTVCDGQEAIQEFLTAQERGQPYHLVIMDLTIPGGMGGKDAIAHLKEIDPGVKALVSSGYSNDPVMSNHHEHGFDGMVVKPFDLTDLCRTVQEVVAGDSKE